MKKIYLAICAIMLCATIKAQIIRVYTSPSTIAAQIPGLSEVSTIATKTVSYTPSVAPTPLTPVDEDTTTEENKLYRYADILSVSISNTDGNITSTSAGKVWTLRVSIPNALNIGFVFDSINLGTSAEMYIYNEDQTVLDSAIKMSDFTYSSKIGIYPIKGNSVIIYIVEKNNFGSLQSSIAILQLEAGFQNIDDVGDQGSSAMQRSINCIPHVKCYPWHDMSARAVARFVSNGYQGTGTLINNEANNGRAYFLTAFHVVDANDNGAIDVSEQTALNSSRFQFQFWRTQCNGSVNATGIQFTGSVIRAQNKSSDMIMLELLNPPGIGDAVNYAGWSRQTSGSSNSQSYIIHHPSGEDMRHTQTRFVRNYLWNSNYWQAGYSSGVVVPGSSGSALFNEYSQVIGQLKAGWSSCGFTDFSDRYGKFYKSWDNSNLQQWLSPTQSLQSTPTLVLFPMEVQGSDVIACTSPSQYNVPAGLEGCTYQWTVSNNLQILGGQGTATVSVQAIANTNWNYTGTITCTLTTALKGRTRVLVVNKSVTFSIASIEGYYTTGNTVTQNPLQVDYNGDNPVSPWTTSYVTITSPEITTQTWTLQSGNPSSWQFNSQTNKLEMVLPSNGWALFRLNSPTTCGNAQFEFLFYATDGSFYRMSPNPASSNVSIAVDEEKIAKQNIAKSNDQDIREVIITDKTGIVKQRNVYGKSTRQINLNVSALKPDIYLVRIFNGKLWTTLRFIKQ